MHIYIENFFFFSYSLSFLYPAGNEYFRALVRKHKVAYVACPKPQKGKYSRIIVDEIYIRGGRFLKQNTTDKLWYDIGDKKALDKTRQALREGAPELLKEIKPEVRDYICPRVIHVLVSVQNSMFQKSLWRCYLWHLFLVQPKKTSLEFSFFHFMFRNLI